MKCLKCQGELNIYSDIKNHFCPNCFCWWTDKELENFTDYKVFQKTPPKEIARLKNLNA